MQAQLAEWLDRVHGGPNLRIASLGVAEEAFELAWWTVKAQQRLVNGRSRWTETELLANIVDSVGDCALYCCHFCIAHSMDFAAALGHSDYPPSEDGLSRLLKAVEPFRLCTPQKYDVLQVLQRLRDCARDAGTTLDAAMAASWTEVSARDDPYKRDR